jgi:hypothetical protein
MEKPSMAEWNLRIALAAAACMGIGLGCTKENTVDASVNETNCGDNAMDCIPCTPGKYRCDGSTMKVCQEDGVGYDAVTMCVSAALCLKGLAQRVCAPPVCTAADRKCEGATMWSCAPGQDALVETKCTSSEACIAGLKDERCAAGECSVASDCTGVETDCRRKKCISGKCGFEDLPVGTPCQQGSATCNGQGSCWACNPTTDVVCKDPLTQRTCNGQGQVVDVPCPAHASRCDRGVCLGGPELVWGDDHSGGEYGIDKTEVTRAQYAQWLASNPSLAGQPSLCAYNTSFVPSCEWPAGSKTSHPVVCVDWCDAFAYCKAVGKRLCGKIGGGSIPKSSSPKDATLDQWYNFCSIGGTAIWPYVEDPYAGNASGYGPNMCNGADFWLTYGGTPTTVQVETGGSHGCVTVLPYYGAYQMSGNVAEWIDKCNTSVCTLRGGSFVDAEYHLRCDIETVLSPNEMQPHIGFRCCSDP